MEASQRSKSGSEEVEDKSVSWTIKGVCNISLHMFGNTRTDIEMQNQGNEFKLRKHVSMGLSIACNLPLHAGKIT